MFETWHCYGVVGCSLASDYVVTRGVSCPPFQDATIGYPTVPETNIYSRSVKIFPSECRERAATYKAKMSITLRWKVDGELAGTCDKVAGQVPIMVKVGVISIMYIYIDVNVGACAHPCTCIYMYICI